MTDVNAADLPSAPPHAGDEDDRSFLLDQSHAPMDVDVDDQIIAPSPAKLNGYRATDSIENGASDEREPKEVVRLG